MKFRAFSKMIFPSNHLCIQLFQQLFIFHIVASVDSPNSRSARSVEWQAVCNLGLTTSQTSVLQPGIDPGGLSVGNEVNRWCWLPGLRRLFKCFVNGDLGVNIEDCWAENGYGFNILELLCSYTEETACKIFLNLLYFL